MKIELRQVRELPAGFPTLQTTAANEGYTMLTRMQASFADGSNRFDKPGECLIAATVHGVLVGIGGLNVDPYVVDATTGRIRHLYVLPSWRGHAIGRRLVAALETHAAETFTLLRLFTPNEDARAFYDAIGYQRVTHLDRVTHIKHLSH